ncbi:MAG: hypothetical protein ABIQ73_00065 [Acidimicrobiales bacterium]
MGAEQAIGAAGDDARIHAVIAEGSTARGARDEGDPGRGVSGWLVRYFDWTTAQAADLMTSAHRPTKLRDAIAAAAPRPVLIIAAGTLPPEVDAAHVFQSAAPDSVELWIAPDAGHTTAYDTYPEEWGPRDRVLRPHVALSNGGDRLDEPAPVSDGDETRRIVLMRFDAKMRDTATTAHHRHRCRRVGDGRRAQEISGALDRCRTRCASGAQVQQRSRFEECGQHTAVQHRPRVVADVAGVGG